MEIDLTGQAALLVSRDGPFVGPLQEALEANGASVVVRDPAVGDPKSVVSEALKTAGRLDVLVFVSPTLSEKRKDDASASGAAAVAGSLHSYAHAAAAALTEAGGRIVVIGSALGLLPSRRNPLGGLADAVHFQLVRESTLRLGVNKVRINGLALGAIGRGGAEDTPLIAGDEGFLSHTAVKSPGAIADVTNAMLFLADPENTYMTGHILTVDGGWTAGFVRDF